MVVKPSISVYVSISCGCFSSICFSRKGGKLLQIGLSGTCSLWQSKYRQIWKPFGTRWWFHLRRSPFHWAFLPVAQGAPKRTRIMSYKQFWHEFTSTLSSMNYSCISGNMWCHLGGDLLKDGGSHILVAVIRVEDLLLAPLGDKLGNEWWWLLW